MYREPLVEDEAWSNFESSLNNEKTKNDAELNFLAQKITDCKNIEPRLKSLYDIAFKHNWDLLPKDFVDWLLNDCKFKNIGLPSKHDEHSKIYDDNELCEICKIKKLQKK